MRSSCNVHPVALLAVVLVLPVVEDIEERTVLLPGRLDQYPSFAFLARASGCCIRHYPVHAVDRDNIVAHRSILLPVDIPRRSHTLVVVHTLAVVHILAVASLACIPSARRTDRKSLT